MWYHNKRLQENLEIPVEYIFNDNEKAIQWAKKNLDNIDAKEFIVVYSGLQLFVRCLEVSTIRAVR